MNPETIRALVRQHPFQPFDVLLSSGQCYRVSRPDAVMLVNNTVVVGDHDRDAVIWCSLAHVASVRAAGPSPAA